MVMVTDVVVGKTYSCCYLCSSCSKRVRRCGAPSRDRVALELESFFLSHCGACPAPSEVVRNSSLLFMLIFACFETVAQYASSQRTEVYNSAPCEYRRHLRFLSLLWFDVGM